MAKFKLSERQSQAILVRCRLTGLERDKIQSERRWFGCLDYLLIFWRNQSVWLPSSRKNWKKSQVWRCSSNWVDDRRSPFSWRWGLDRRNRCLITLSNKGYIKRSGPSGIYGPVDGVQGTGKRWWLCPWTGLYEHSWSLALFTNKGRVYRLKGCGDSRIYGQPKITNRQPLKIGWGWIDSKPLSMWSKTVRSLSLLYDATRFSQRPM